MRSREAKTGLIRPDAKLLSGKRAAVIGVGYTGLAQALLLQESGCKVTIYSPSLVSETTSNSAGASLKPSNGDFPDKDRMHAATRRSRRALQSLADGGIDGIETDHTHIEARDGILDDKARSWINGKEWYLQAIDPDYKTLTDSSKIPGHYGVAISYKTIFVDSPIALESMFRLFQERGGEFKQRPKFKSLQELAKLDEDFVFNCTGLGSRELANDKNMYPGKGQVVVIGGHDELDFSISSLPNGENIPQQVNAFYIYRRRRPGGKSETVLGGTFEESDDPSIDLSVRDALLTGAGRVLNNGQLVPASEIRREYVDFRPNRRGGVRIEREIVNGKTIIHNYGLGGSGLLAFGTSAEALEQIGVKIAELS